MTPHLAPPPVRSDSRCAESERSTSANLGSHLGSITPTHQGRPASTPYRKTRPEQARNRAESAKPPSPVQIRAAPPIEFSSRPHLRASARGKKWICWSAPPGFASHSPAT
jgi:hypothetical protein